MLSGEPRDIVKSMGKGFHKGITYHFAIETLMQRERATS